MKSQHNNEDEEENVSFYADDEYKYDIEYKDDIEVQPQDTLDVKSSTNTNDAFGENELTESQIIAESKNLIIDEKTVKTYWGNDTENGIIEFLYLNEFFFENRIKEEYDDAIKEKRIVNKFYCEEMQRKLNEVLLIKDREERREKIFREKIKTPLKKEKKKFYRKY